MNWFGWSLLSAIFAAVTAILAKIGVSGVNSHVATAVRTSVALVITWTMALWLAPARAVLGLSGNAILCLALSGAATGLSWLCYFRALQVGDVSKVAPVDKLSVVFVVGISVVLLGETLTWRMLLGTGMIALGAVVLAGSS